MGSSRYGKRAARLASSSGVELSRKRTDFEGVGEEGFGERLKEEDEGIRGRVSFARANDGEREGSFGLFIEDWEVVGKPRNRDVRSSNWVRSCWDDSLRLEDRVLWFR